MIIDGKKLANEIILDLASRNIKKTLAVVLAGNDPASKSFIRIKEQVGARAGVSLVVHHIPKDSTEEEVVKIIEDVGNDEDIDGIIVQLPLPNHLSTETVLGHIPPEKDVDGLLPDSRHTAPVARAVKEIFKQYNVNLDSKNVLVVGQGRLVGLPVTKWLEEQNIQVTTADITTTNLPALTEKADIIITGVGNPNLITPDMIHDGVVLIDAGTSESAGKLVGDTDPTCAKKTSLYSPVPGGVGPLTIAMLFANMFEA